MSEDFWTIICPWVLSHSIMPEKIGQSLFFTGHVAFFQKFMFSTTYFPQKWSYYFHSKSQTTFWTFTNRSLGFVTIDNRRKKKGIFFQGKGCLFSKSFCFHQPLESLTNDVLTSTVKVILPCGTLYVDLLRLSCPILREKIGQNLLFSGIVTYFSKSFVFNNL